MRIYLVGFMGAGKTTVGRNVAYRLGWSFVDLDREIERRAGRTIPEIFEREGEEGFRAREAEALRVVAEGERERLVVATGGGALTRAENRALIRATGRSVFLDAPLDLLFERIERSPRVRPLYPGREQARRLYESRLDHYRGADVVIPVVPGDQADRVAERVVGHLGSISCGT